MDHETTATVATARTGRAPLLRIGLLGAAAAALVAVGILAAGMSLAPAGTLASTSDAGSNATDVASDLFMGGRGGPGHAFGGITITAISGNSISLKTADGWTRTITVDSGTTYSRSGDTIALSDLKVGDEIRFRQTREDDGSFTIDAVAVVPPHLGGVVTAISGSTITVEGRDGSTGTIKVSSSTTYQVNGDSAALSDVKVDMVLVAEGTLNADGSLNATEVRAGSRGDGFGGPGHGPRGGWGLDD